MLRGIPAHRRNGSANGATVGLSEGRLALVERYMVEGEDAEPKAEQTPAVAPGWAERAAEQRARRVAERAERDARERRREPERARGEAGELVLRRAAAAELEPAGDVDRPVARRPQKWSTAKEKVRAQKALAEAERRAAKQAERAFAALEKKEARERKALAKAAAKREGRERKALVRSMVRP